jgi:hypothetical protein
MSKYIVMLSKRLRELLVEYAKLPFIVYKHKFLIPQRPPRVYVNYLIGMKGNIEGSFASGLP